MWVIDYGSARHVGRHRGTLPVVLACPHGGGATLPVPERTGQGLPRHCHFTTTRDRQTMTITTGIAQRLLELRGEAPYVVLADFHRRYVDVNRSADCAYETAGARPYYDEYHQTLRGFVDEVCAENGGRGLLFDIHGTAGLASDPADLYLGTAAGKSVARLLRINAYAMSRRRGLGGLLTAAGYVVSLNPPALGGGYTVETYGSSHAGGIDAVQIEIAAPLRTSAARRAVLIDDLAWAISILVDRYIAIAAQGPTAQLQRGRAGGDSRLRLGGARGQRGRLGLRHDAVSPHRAGIAPQDPGSDSEAGQIVGGQS